MTLKEEISDWRQPDGLIVPKSEREGVESPDTTGDGIKHFSHYHGLLVKRGESRPEDFVEFNSVIESCFVRPGLLHRSPTKTGEQISKDALIGATYAARLLKSPLAYSVLARGDSMRLGPLKWFYPNLFPERFEAGGSVPFKMLFTKDLWSSWMGKNPEVITHLQWAGLPVGHRPHPLRVLWQGFYFVVVGASNDGLNTLNQMMAETAYGKSDFLDLCIDFWAWRVGDIRESFERELEPNHPIARYWR